MPWEAARVLAACRRSAAAGCGADPDWAAALSVVDCREAAAGLVIRARDAYQAASAAARRARAEGWHKYVEEQFRVGGRRVFQWVRSPAAAAPPPLVQLDGRLVGGPAADVAAAEAAWTPFSLQPDARPPDEDRWLEPVRGLPAFPAPPALTEDEVAAAMQSLPCGKAPGLDDWIGEELRLWPRPLARGLLQLLVAVGRLGRWPDGLSGAEVVLPLKPDGDPTAPLDRRPLNLLPVVYRLWARLRGRAVSSWRRGWDPAMAAARLGADGQAWELSWAQAEAEALGLDFGGLAVDFRKAYDSVRLPLVARLLAAAGGRRLSPAHCWPRTLRRGACVLPGLLGDPFGRPQASLPVAPSPSTSWRY
jgi:hypothetical protein